MVIAEKRVYDASAGRTRLAVATGHGLAVVGVSADVIGEFGLTLDGAVRDVVAAGGGHLLAATARDVLVVALAEEAVAGAVATAGTGAGPSTALSIVGGDAGTDGAAVVAAGEDGVVRRASLSAVLDADGPDPETDDAGLADGASATTPTWTTLGEAPVRRADGRLLAAADGVHRVGADGLARVGLDDARDVAAPEAVDAPGPFAATGDGLYRLGPGWTEELAGSFEVVAARVPGPRAADSGAPEPVADAHAVRDGGRDGDRDGDRDDDRDDDHDSSGDELLAHAADGWTPVEVPARSPVACVAYGETGTGEEAEEATPTTYAVAGDGTVLVDAGDGWRSRSIGLGDVAGCAVVR